MKRYKSILITGLQAVGKTTLANQLSQLLNYPITAIDNFRDGMSDGTIEGEAYAQKRFEARVRQQSAIAPGLYEAVGGKAFRTVVANVKDLHIIKCVCPENIRLERLASRNSMVLLPYVGLVDLPISLYHSRFDTSDYDLIDIIIHLVKNKSCLKK